MRSIRVAMAGCLTLFAVPVFAAFDLTPIIATVTPGGPGATTSFTLSNADDTKTPVQITIVKREPDESGNEKHEETADIGEMFQIFPSQLILNPKEQRTVRVTYVGDPKIKRELAFRVIAEEFPINVTDDQKVKKKAVASIAIATKYVGSLYVTPTGSKPDLSIEATMNTATAGKKELVLVMENKGTEHIILKNAKYKAVTAKKDYDLPKETVEAIGPQNILAGRVRKIVVPWPSNVPTTGPIKVTVETIKQ